MYGGLTMNQIYSARICLFGLTDGEMLSQSSWSRKGMNQIYIVKI